MLFPQGELSPFSDALENANHGAWSLGVYTCSKVSFVILILWYNELGTSPRRSRKANQGAPKLDARLWGTPNINICQNRPAKEMTINQKRPTYIKRDQPKVTDKTTRQSCRCWAPWFSNRIYIHRSNCYYRVAKSHRIPYLCRSFSAKVTYI